MQTCKDYNKYKAEMGTTKEKERLVEAAGCCKQDRQRLVHRRPNFDDIANNNAN